MKKLKILEQNINLVDAFKWMYNPFQQIIIVGSTYDQYHLDILDHYAKKHNVDNDFSNWIRAIHLNNYDFKNDKTKRILCIREFDENKFNIKEVKKLIDSLGFKSKKVYHITNEKLQVLTGDYFRKW